MYIKSALDGCVLFEDDFSTIKKTAENAVKQNIPLPHADFRKADLRSAALDGLNAPGACLWGADLSGTDLAEVYLHGADLRLAHLKEACLADSVLTSCDCRGTVFQRTILTGCDISGSDFSCPSFLAQNFEGIGSMVDCTYHYKGETECRLSRPPVVLTGLTERITQLDNHTIIGGTLHETRSYCGEYSAIIQALTSYSTTIGYIKNLHN